MPRTEKTTGSLRAYAAHRKARRLDGGSLAGVQKAIASGRIQTKRDGTIDFARADSDWERNTQVRTPPASSPASPIATGGESVTAASAFNTARAVHEKYKAQLAKLEFERRTGKLLEADDVRQAVGGMIATARDRLLVLPGELGPELAKEQDAAKCAELVEQRIHRALEALATYPG